MRSKVVMIVFMLSFQVVPELWAGDGASANQTLGDPTNMNNQSTAPVDALTQTAPVPAGSTLPTTQPSDETLQPVEQDLTDLYNAMVAAQAEADEADRALDNAEAAKSAAEVTLLSAEETFNRLKNAVISEDPRVNVSLIVMNDAQKRSKKADQEAADAERAAAEAEADWKVLSDEASLAVSALNNLPPDADPGERRRLQAAADAATAAAQEAYEDYSIAEAFSEEAAGYAAECYGDYLDAQSEYNDAVETAIAADPDATAAKNAYDAAEENYSEAVRAAKAARAAANEAHGRAVAATRAYNQALANNP